MKQFFLAEQKKVRTKFPTLEVVLSPPWPMDKDMAKLQKTTLKKNISHKIHSFKPSLLRLRPSPF